MYLYLSNDNAALGGNVIEVFFDDFTVEHVKSPVVQQDDYYAFGLNFNSFQRENAKKNNYLYNQGTGDKTFKTERVVELELNVDQSKLRTYDYITGRWWQVDPLADDGTLTSLTPYNYSGNDPVRYSDPNGDCPTCPLAAKWARMIGGMVSQSGTTKPAVTNLMTNSSQTGQNTAKTSEAVNLVDTKQIAKVGDGSVISQHVAKNAKTITNEASKDGIMLAKSTGTALELTGVGAPAGAAINTAANALDEGRQVAFEGKSSLDAIQDFGVNVVVDQTFSGLGNAAKSTVKSSEAGKETFDKAVDLHSMAYSAVVNWAIETFGDKGNKKGKE